jgi:hypothetical protein
MPITFELLREYTHKTNIVLKALGITAIDLLIYKARAVPSSVECPRYRELSFKKKGL